MAFVYKEIAWFFAHVTFAKHFVIQMDPAEASLSNSSLVLINQAKLGKVMVKGDKLVAPRGQGQDQEEADRLESFKEVVEDKTGRVGRLDQV